MKAKIRTDIFTYKKNNGNYIVKSHVSNKDIILNKKQFNEIFIKIENTIERNYSRGNSLIFTGKNAENVYPGGIFGFTIDKVYNISHDEDGYYICDDDEIARACHYGDGEIFECFKIKKNKKEY